MYNYILNSICGLSYSEHKFYIPCTACQHKTKRDKIFIKSEGKLIDDDLTDWNLKFLLKLLQIFVKQM